MGKVVSFICDHRLPAPRAAANAAEILSNGVRRYGGDDASGTCREERSCLHMDLAAFFKNGTNRIACSMILLAAFQATDYYLSNLYEVLMWKMNDIVKIP